MLSNQDFAWFLCVRCGLVPSISLSIIDFSVYQLQQVALFPASWCDYHECRMCLIFHLLHTRKLLFICFVNIHNNWELLIVEVSLVCIVNASWRCIYFRNLIMKILSPCWHDYLPLFICNIILFTMNIHSNFLIALKHRWNPA